VAEQASPSGYMTEVDDVGKVPPGLQDFMAKAEEALRRHNYPYAIAMYRRVLSDMPGNLWVRRRLRGTELRRNQEGSRPNPVLGTVLGVPALVKVAVLGGVGKHVAAMDACEAFLARVPTNVWVLRRLAEHAFRLGLFETAVFSLENALEVKRNSVKVLVRLGEFYEKVKRIDKAVQCMQVAADLRPNDRELAKRANDMSAVRTIAHARLEEGDYRKSLADEQLSVELDRDHRIERTEADDQRQIHRARADMEAHPDDVGAARRLAGAYRAAEDFDNAYAWYQRASELDPKEFQLQVMMGDMRRAKYRQQIREAQDAVAQQPDNRQAAADLERLQRELADLELAEFKRRVEAYPTNLELKYQYGIRLFDRGEVLPAIQQFQRSVREPKRSRQSRMMLGRCFLAQEHPDLAKEQFLRALQGKEILDDREALDLYYYLAEAQEALTDYAGALDSYGRIYSVDVMFRDVVDRMERARGLAKGTPSTNE